MQWSDDLMEELVDLKFDSFSRNITEELLKQSEFELLRAEEKDLNIKIKKVIDEERKARDETTK